MGDMAWEHSNPLPPAEAVGAVIDHSAYHHDHHASSDKPLIVALGIGLLLYAVAGALGWPQAATEMIVGGHAHAEAAHPHAAEAPGAAAEHDHHAAVAHGPAEHESPIPPTLLTVLPFAFLLGAIAVFPLMPQVSHWWESNLNRFYVAAGLGGLTLLYYLVAHEHAVERHFLGHALISPGDMISLGLAWTVVQNAIFNEYIPFIVLLFSLYTICGGIRIEGDLRAHPLTNTTFIGIGGLLASFIGTTGAAMLLIRPLLQTNHERKHVRHTVIFFIFVVCNCGGLLLPIGDPPLFLGYLQGVDFLWTMSLWPSWLFVNGMLLLIYFIWDRFYHYPSESLRDVLRDERQATPLRIRGLGVNGLLLAGVGLSVMLLDPGKVLPGTQWHPWLYLREVSQLSLVLLSLVLSSQAVREANQFNFHAILEVAALFFGIFLCMQPALQILDVQGGSLGIDTSLEFFWATGILSSVLDNAPTYLVFFKTAQALPSGDVPLMAGVAVNLLTAISLGAVFMGAMTYIGNGPNFMVKAIAEKSGVQMPGFFGYMVYSCLILLPLMVLASMLFVR